MLSIKKIFDFANCNAESRNFCEGEKILNAKQVILCGTHDPNQNFWSIYALVLKTSALSSPPHTINGIVDKKTLNIKKFTCSCPAGASECCKHILAVLLNINRNDINKLQVLSTTDKKCLWKNLKGPALDEYKATPVSQFHCFKKINHTDIVNMNQLNFEKVYNTFITQLPNSALAKHAVGRIQCNEHDTENLYFQGGDINLPQRQKTEIIAICKHAETDNKFMNRLAELYVPDISPCCREFYINNIVIYNNLELCEKTLLDENAWQKERQYRITGSRCYSIFTYKKNDWISKSNLYFWPKAFSNKHTI